MTLWQETAALRDFKPAYDRYGSFATDEVEGARPRICPLYPADIVSAHSLRQLLANAAIAASRVSACPRAALARRT